MQHLAQSLILSKNCVFNRYVLAKNVLACKEGLFLCTIFNIRACGAKIQYHFKSSSIYEIRVHVIQVVMFIFHSSSYIHLFQSLHSCYIKKQLYFLSVERNFRYAVCSSFCCKEQFFLQKQSTKDSVSNKYTAAPKQATYRQNKKNLN